MPAISVLLAVYNNSEYLGRAIESILSQSFTDFELIIVDDGSTDGAGNICDQYAALDQRIVVKRNKQNLGLTRSLNIALSPAKGEFIARMDADDISHPLRFETQIRYLRENPDVGLIGTFYQIMEEDGSIRPAVERFPTQPMIVKWHLAFENPIPHPSIMTRRALLEKAGGYDERWETSQDYDLFARLSHITKLDNLPDVLFYWRVHRKSVTSVKNYEQGRNAISISQNFVSELLGKPVSAELTGLLWNRRGAGARDVALTSTTMIALAKKILDEPQWTMDEKTIFRKYAANKVFNYLRPWLATPAVWAAFCKLTAFDPRLILDRVVHFAKAGAVQE